MQHSGCILAVAALHLFILLDEFKPEVLDDGLERGVDRLNASLALDIREVIEQWPKIDLDSAILEDPVICLDKLEDVVGTVDEEAGDHSPG